MEEYAPPVTITSRTLTLLRVYRCVWRPAGQKGTWEAMVNFKDTEPPTVRTESAKCPMVEDHAPLKSVIKETVKGVTAKVKPQCTWRRMLSITRLGSSANADWIRKSMAQNRNQRKIHLSTTRQVWEMVFLKNFAIAS
jgi:hypothetical protein